MIETFPLYGGEISLEYSDSNHQYRVVKGNRRFKVPSVTRITGVVDKSGPLIPWAINSTLDLIRAAIQPDTPYPEVLLEEIYSQAKKEASRKKGEAAARGTLVHAILSGEPEAELVGADDSIVRKAEAGKEWLKENEVDLLSIERPIYSRRWRYSGRFDGVGTVRGIPTLLDWKTGKGIYSEFRLQTAAYQHAWEEEFPDQLVQQRIILHLGEEGVTPYYFPRELFRKDFAAFCGAHKLFTQLQVIEKQLRSNKSKKQRV